MHFTPSIFGKLVEPINRRQFQAIVERHDGDAYVKCFTSWEHLVALVFAQLCASTSLRGLEASWNANSQHHYHLACGPLVRSTLSDANRRRPVAIFAETFALVAGQLDRNTRREGTAMVRLIDSTPIPLGKLYDWAKSNGRIRGMKMHVVYDPGSDHPRILDITDANVNDAQIGRTIVLEANMALKLVCDRPIKDAQGDGFTVLEDAEVSLASKGDSKLPIRLRRLIVQRQEGDTITLLTNDLERSAVDIAQLYKGRWQIELLFRWIKQHLKIRKFLGYNDNAIRLQLFAAMIAYALLRIAARAFRVAIPILRFTELVMQFLFERRRIDAIDKPPPVNPNRRRDRTSPDQIGFAYV
jgi:IS4 transposase